MRVITYSFNINFELGSQVFGLKQLKLKPKNIGALNKRYTPNFLEFFSPLILLFMQKHLLLITLFSFSIIVMSCSTKMYQVLETSSTQINKQPEGVIFENSDVKITYDFWTNGGKVEFLMYNKLNTPLYVNWDKSHLIYNGISYEYWLDSEQSSSMVSSSSVGSSTGNSSALVNLLTGATTTNSSTKYQGRKVVAVASSNYRPKKIIQIPPRSSIRMSNFDITKVLFYDCEVNLKNTSIKKAATKTFTSENSPMAFRNYITYSADAALSKDIVVDNDFYVSKVSLMSEPLFRGKLEKIKGCDLKGGSNTIMEYTFPYKKSNSFYIQFNKM